MKKIKKKISSLLILCLFFVEIQKLKKKTKKDEKKFPKDINKLWTNFFLNI